MMMRVRSCSRSIGVVASTPNCGCASREPVNTAARRPKTRWRSCAAWLVAGQTNTSPRRSIEWACRPAKAKLGRRTASLRFGACAESTPIESAEKDGEWLTMTEAAKALGVTNHTIRRLIKDRRRLRPSRLMRGAPHQIRADDLASGSGQSRDGPKGSPVSRR